MNRKLNIKQQIIIIIIVSQVFLLVSAFYILYSQHKLQIKNNFYFKIKNDLHQYQGVVKTLLKLNQMPELNNFISSLGSDITNEGIYLVDSKGDILFSTNISAINKKLTDEIGVTLLREFSENIFLEKDGKYIGKSSICFNDYEKCYTLVKLTSPEFLISKERKLLINSFALLVVLFCIIDFVVFVTLYYRINLRLNYLLNYFKLSISYEDFEALIKSDDEFAFLARKHEESMQELKATNKKYFEKSLELQGLIGKMHDGFIAIDKYGEIRIFNAACEKIFGYKQNEIIGKNIGVLMFDKEKDMHNKAINEYWKTRKKKIIDTSRELTAKHKDGSAIPIVLSVSEAYTEGYKGAYFIATIQDLRESKKMETFIQNAEKMKITSLLASSFAHDFNNLLTISTCNLELVKEKVSESKDITEILDASLNALNRGAYLIDGMLSLTRVEKKLEYINITKFLKEFASFLSSFMGNDIKVKYYNEELRDMFISTNLGELETCLSNLAINSKEAIKGNGKFILRLYEYNFTQSEKISGNLLVESDYLCIEIEDTGLGIKAENLDKIFNPFFSMKDKTNNSGLGLNTVFSFVKRNDGFIEVESKENKGTIFKLYFPQVKNKMAKNMELEESSLKGNGQKILFIDSLEGVNEFVSFILPTYGYKMELVKASASIVDFIKSREYDLVFLDESVYIKYIKELKFLEKGLYNVLLAVSSEKIWGEGFSIIKKPYSRYDILEALRKIFK